MRVAALAGGVGGAKLLIGLAAALGGLEDSSAEDLTAIVNTGDDATMYGLNVSPDVDIVTYWLAGMADFERGWGIAGDTFDVVTALERFDANVWFRLGDRDMATCMYRTRRLRDGVPLSHITDDIRKAFRIKSRILPMTDDHVATLILTPEGDTLEFQEYFVKLRQEPEVTGIALAGIAEAKPAAGVIDAIASADRVVICPSNPIVSIGPILALHGVRDALRSHRDVVAVSPIIGGKALKGPADKMLAGLGHTSAASTVARLYSDFCRVFVVDATDTGEIPAVEAEDVAAVALDTIMSDKRASRRLAKKLLEL